MHQCRLSLKAQGDLRRLEGKFPKMAELVTQALRDLSERAEATSLTRAVAISRGLLARQVISPEAQQMVVGENPGWDDDDPDDEVAPDYFIFYEPFSWTDRLRYKARHHVIRILSSTDAGEQYSIEAES
jgi:hypothetical protein